MKPTIELHIEELILTGVDRGDAARVAQAVQERLESLLREHGLPPGLAAGAEIRELRAGHARRHGRDSAAGRDSTAGRDSGGYRESAALKAAGGGTSPEQLGNHVAQAVYSGFNPKTTS